MLSLGDDGVVHYCRWRGAWLSGQRSPSVEILRHHGMVQALAKAAALRHRPGPAPKGGRAGDVVAAAAAMIAGVLTMETGTGDRA